MQLHYSNLTQKMSFSEDRSYDVLTDLCSHTEEETATDVSKDLAAYTFRSYLNAWYRMCQMSVNAQLVKKMSIFGHRTGSLLCLKKSRLPKPNVSRLKQSTA
jgi:hypothetical protein